MSELDLGFTVPIAVFGLVSTLCCWLIVLRFVVLFPRMAYMSKYFRLSTVATVVLFSVASTLMCAMSVVYFFHVKARAFWLTAMLLFILTFAVAKLLMYAIFWGRLYWAFGGSALRLTKKEIQNFGIVFALACLGYLFAMYMPLVGICVGLTFDVAFCSMIIYFFIRQLWQLVENMANIPSIAESSGITMFSAVQSLPASAVQCKTPSSEESRGSAVVSSSPQQMEMGVEMAKLTHTRSVPKKKQKSRPKGSKRMSSPPSTGRLPLYSHSSLPSTSTVSTKSKSVTASATATATKTALLRAKDKEETSSTKSRTWTVPSTATPSSKASAGSRMSATGLLLLDRSKKKKRRESESVEKDTSHGIIAKMRSVKKRSATTTAVDSSEYGIDSKVLKALSVSRKPRLKAISSQSVPLGSGGMAEKSFDRHMREHSISDSATISSEHSSLSSASGSNSLSGDSTEAGDMRSLKERIYRPLMEMESSDDLKKAEEKEYQPADGSRSHNGEHVASVSCPQPLAADSHLLLHVPVIDALERSESNDGNGNGGEETVGRLLSPSRHLSEIISGKMLSPLSSRGMGTLLPVFSAGAQRSTRTTDADLDLDTLARQSTIVSLTSSVIEIDDQSAERQSLGGTPIYEPRIESVGDFVEGEGEGDDDESTEERSYYSPHSKSLSATGTGVDITATPTKCGGFGRLPGSGRRQSRSTRSSVSTRKTPETRVTDSGNLTPLELGTDALTHLSIASESSSGLDTLDTGSSGMDTLETGSSGVDSERVSATPESVRHFVRRRVERVESQTETETETEEAIISGGKAVAQRGVEDEHVLEGEEEEEEVGGESVLHSSEAEAVLRHMEEAISLDFKEPEESSQTGTGLTPFNLSPMEAERRHAEFSKQLMAGDISPEPRRRRRRTASEEATISTLLTERGTLSVGQRTTRKSLTSSTWSDPKTMAETLTETPRSRALCGTLSDAKSSSDGLTATMSMTSVPEMEDENIEDDDFGVGEDLDFEVKSPPKRRLRLRAKELKIRRTQPVSCKKDNGKQKIGGGILAADSSSTAPRSMSAPASDLKRDMLRSTKSMGSLRSRRLFGRREKNMRRTQSEKEKGSFSMSTSRQILVRAAAKSGSRVSVNMTRIGDIIAPVSTTTSLGTAVSGHRSSNSLSRTGADTFLDPGQIELVQTMTRNTMFGAICILMTVLFTAVVLVRFAKDYGQHAVHRIGRHRLDGRYADRWLWIQALFLFMHDLVVNVCFFLNLGRVAKREYQYVCNCCDYGCEWCGITLTERAIVSKHHSLCLAAATQRSLKYANTLQTIDETQDPAPGCQM